MLEIQPKLLSIPHLTLNGRDKMKYDELEEEASIHFFSEENL